MSAPAAPRLVLPPYDYAAARRLAHELPCSHVLAQILTRRGLHDANTARAWLAGDERHDPAAFAGIGVATALILRHVETHSRITIHGDYDVDGVTSTAILVRALRALGADVDWYLPSRIEDGYGLQHATVERLAQRGTRLLVTVDCAITAVEEVAGARVLGLDVVVTDHHSPRADGVLPDAPIVHPALCGYPCRDLCAAGVAHKLVAALASAAGADPALADADLDLVALATICDVVPLRGENRRLVREGLRALSLTDKPGLRALMAVARLDPGGLDAAAVGFRLGPRINAAGRMHRADAGVELLLTEDEDRAAAIAAELDAANAQRRAVEQRILWEAEAQAAEQGERPAFVLVGQGWHPGVIGIVASRIAERHHRPAVLVALDGEQGTGSGRSIPAYDLLSGLHAAAPVLVRYGGHRAAAGLTVRAADVDRLRTLFEAHAAATLTAADLVPERRVDAVVPGSALGLVLAEELAALEPCGAGNPSPVLLVAAATLGDPRPMGEEGRHLRFTVEAGGSRARAVSFGCGGRLPVEAGTPADVAVRLERNEWNGAVEPRLLLRHAAPCAPAPIDVVGEPADYLAAALGRGQDDGEGLLAPVGASAGVARALLEPAGASAVAARRPPAARELLDRRRDGAVATLADLCAAGGLLDVLAVVADVPRRVSGLASRLGGFRLCSWDALEADPALAAATVHLVALDPPLHPDQELLLRAGRRGWAHVCWDEPEVEFALRVLALEHDLRPALAALYRDLRAAGGVLAGDALAAVLRGAGAHARSPALAGRLLLVLSELGLARVESEGVALAMSSVERTSLERSSTYRASARRLEDGRRFLSASTVARAA